MIASYTHNFIFLKGRKVGGTSLEIVLGSWCAEGDVCSRIPPIDERVRATYGGRARNFSRADGSIRFSNHMPGAAVAIELPDLWPEAYKFTVERHPYEKVISRAWWQLGRRGDTADHLAAEIEEAIESKSYINYPIYVADGAPVVDEVWRYDEMWERAAALAERLGTAMPAVIPRTKSSHRKDHRPARDILTEAQRERIYNDSRIEFDLLGFKP